MSKPDGFMIKDIGLPLLELGYEVLPIAPGEKVPRLPKWSSLVIDRSRVEAWKANGRARHYVGIRTGEVTGVDIDIDDAAVTESVASDFGWSFGEGPRRYGKPGRVLLAVRCPGGGKKKTLKLTSPDGRDHAIEILMTGQQFVAYGIHPDLREPYRWENGDLLDCAAEDLPEVSDADLAQWLDSVPALLPEGWKVAEGSEVFDEDELFLLAYRPPVAVEAMPAVERVQYEAMRRFVDWVPQVFGQDAKEYQGGYRVSSETLGRDLQEDLSIHPQGIRDHGEETGMTPVQVVAKWHSNGDEDEALKALAGWLGVDLKAQAKSAVQETQKAAPIQKWLDRMDSSDDLERLKRVAAGVGRDADLAEVDRERLAMKFQGRFKALEGSHLSIAVARKAVKRTGGGVDRVDTPEAAWADRWYYVTHNDKLYRYGTDQWVSPQGFNAMYQRELPPDDEGRRPSALRYALDDLEIPAVEVGMYCPQFGERFTISGRDCVNTFNPASIPEADDWLDADGQRAVEVMDRHIQFIAGNRPAVYKALLDFIAYNVQHPGRKIRYAPLVKGIEGDGKTLLLELIAVCIGEPNTRTVGPSVVMGNFNGFAEGRCVVGLEEVRLVGHNRYDAMNALKPLITNNTVDIHKKGQDSYNALNVTNYMAFTNYSDALPVTATDRRWFVIFTPWSTPEEMEDRIGQRMDSYFTEVHQALEQAGALRRWLLDHKLSASFNPNGHAPRTPEKESMRAADADDDETVVAQRLEMGGEGVTEKAVATDCLSQLPPGAEFDVDEILEMPKGRALAKVMQRLGWVHCPKQLKWHGKPRRVWVKGLPLDDNDKIREELNKTIGADYVPF